MDFEFTDDQLSLRDAVARWVDKGFTFERRHAIARKGGATRDVYVELAGLGLTGLAISDAHGGMGFGGLTTNAPPNSVSCAWNNHDAQNGLYPPSSNHSGGVNAVMGDGSVRFIRDSINVGNLNASGRGLNGMSPFGVFGAMGTRAGGESVTDN